MDLFKNFSIMQNKFKKKEYNYCPDTFLIPEQVIAFKDHLSMLKDSPEYDDKKLWIVKPNKLSRGRGIYLLKNFAQLDAKEPGVVSEYVDNPLTVNGHKFDLRIYVVVTSFYPLRIFVYREGLARFATEKYSKDAAESNLYVHLTNYSINKKNKGFDIKRKMADDTLPFKWSLTAFFQRIKELGINVDLMWEQIYDLIIKSILSSERYISYYTKDNSQKINRSFEIFGYDVMIDDKLKPWLMEINLSPSLSLESNMDIKLKTKLVTEMFNMYGFRKLETAKEYEGTAFEADNEEKGENTDENPIAIHEFPKHKSKNLKFIDPDLTPEQRDQLIEQLENNKSIPAEDKEKMIELAGSPHLNNIIEVLAEYTRKADYIRIFPAKGSDSYFKFFKYDLDVNKKLYEFLY
jgi:tubulin polyglutamylase TTLL4